ncbi:hypothetical protein EWM64_g785 [Hericium alpestre]|uniref:Dynamin GTPase domain-containing protein n=1 Tax=Hericium alpestre TaxID=135208 RepID=A0A4Z0AA63_9AGAM|nr:hypothetical protein EWM64_g785 [Hericium alpestre]
MITNPLQVEERIRRAQAAILTPDESPESFLNKSIRDLTPAATFSANLVSLDIRGPSIQEELSFIDLPGLIRNVGSSGNAGDITLIENLVKSYIVKPSCIILLTIACETDFANQEGYAMARTYDPEGVRTIGVLTKPDRIDAGGESRWLSFIRGEEEHLSNGWFCVKQPDAQGLIKNTSWEAARSEEAAFFSKNETWSSLEDRYHNRLQTKNLCCLGSLSNLLSKVIRDRLPDLKAEVRNLLDSTETELHTLPKPKSNDVVSDFLRLILSFSRAVKDHVSPLKDDGLLHKVKSEKGRFRKEVQSTALDFRPWPRDAKDAFKKLSPPDFLGDDHTTLFGISVVVMSKARRGSSSSEILDDGKVVFLDEVAGKVYRASSRELFDGYPTEVMQDFSRRCIDEWKAPTLRFIEQIAAMTCNAVHDLIQDHFKHYTSGGIQKWVINMVDDHVKACKAKAVEHIEMLLLAEHSIDTGNTQDFRLYKDKFLAYYKSHRQQASGSTFFKEMDSKPYNANAPYPAKAEFQAGMMQAKAAFAKLGLPEVQPVDFAKFMSSDPSEPMLEIMASVSAYLQGSVATPPLHRIATEWIIALYTP